VAVVAGPSADVRVAELRAKGTSAVKAATRAEALLWARAWNFTHVLDGTEWVDVATGDTMASPPSGTGEREST
jgi:hypothetical protein